MQISTEISGEECCKSINNTRLVSGCVQFSKIQQSECSHSACLTDSHQLIIWLKRCEQISVRFFCVVWEGDAYLPGKRRRTKWRPLQVKSTKRWGSCRPLTEMLRVLTDLPVGSRGAFSDENLPTSICLLHCAVMTIFAFVETEFPVVWATLELFFLLLFN